MSKIDDLFKKKLSQRPPVEFDPAAWTAMENMLNQQAAAGAGRKGFWYAIAAIVGLAAIGSGAWMMYSPEELATTQVVDEPVMQSQPSATLASLEPSAKLTATQPINQTVQSTAESQNAIASAHPPVKKGTASATLNSQAFHLANASVDAAQPLDARNEKATPNSNDWQPSQNEINRSGTPQVPSLLTDVPYLNRVPFLAFHSSNQEQGPTELLVSKPGIHRRAHHARYFISLVLGNTFSQGFANAESERDPISYSQYGGIGYEYILNGNLTLGSGLLYTSRGGLNSVKRFEVVEYGFGFDRQTVLLNTKSLHYATVPLNLTYHRGAHGFSGGMDVSYLVNAKSEMTEIIDNSYGIVSVSPSIEQWGYMNGFNRLDLTLVAMYQYNLTPELALGLRGRYGLTDATIDDYYDQVSFDRNLQLQLQLSYKMLDF